LAAKQEKVEEKGDPERLHGILSGKVCDSAKHYHGSAGFDTRPAIFLLPFIKRPKKGWISDAVQCNRWSGVSGHAIALIFRQVDGGLTRLAWGGRKLLRIGIQEADTL
jgi:hypothetical protein